MTQESAQKIGKINGSLNGQFTESFQNKLIRLKAQLAQHPTDVQKYQLLAVIRYTQPDLFYALLISDVQKYTPLVYTPTIGAICQNFSHLYIVPEGLYIPYTIPSIEEVLINYRHSDPRMCVVTDGGRVLGLGDQGIGGLGISIGKLSLYTACAGIRPEHTIPIVLDFGTDNEKLLEDPLYFGLREKRTSKDVQLEFVAKFLKAMRNVYSQCVVQFEDFQTENAFKYLETFRHEYCCFNDDIQGTGAVILAGISNAFKRSGVELKDQKIVFVGSGSAAVGVAKMIAKYFELEGFSEKDAKEKIYLVDTKGLICSNRGDHLADHKVYFARNDIETPAEYKTLSQVVENIRPTALIGLCTVGGCFTPEILTFMAEINSRPIIMPLSNPSTNSECTFEDAVKYTNGRVLFASGSPFDDFYYQDQLFAPSQGNNMYIFPGLGLGVLLSKAKQVTENMVFTAAKTLASSVTEEEARRGLLYPDLKRIRQVSKLIAINVIKCAVDDGVGSFVNGDLEKYVDNYVYNPLN